MTENMAVQDAAYSCMTLLREEHAMLRETSFRYIPAALLGEEGYYTGLYTDHSAEDPLLQMTARLGLLVIEIVMHALSVSSFTPLVPVCIEH